MVLMVEISESEAGEEFLEFQCHEQFCWKSYMYSTHVLLEVQRPSRHFRYRRDNNKVSSGSRRG